MKTATKLRVRNVCYWLTMSRVVQKKLNTIKSGRTAAVVNFKNSRKLLLFSYFWCRICLYIKRSEKFDPLSELDGKKELYILYIYPDALMLWFLGTEGDLTTSTSLFCRMSVIHMVCVNALTVPFVIWCNMIGGRVI